jgi:hypothetical protein
MPYQGRLLSTFASQIQQDSIAVTQGSQGTPSITFFGDTNNGIFSPSADNISITTNGTERLRVDSSGNIGIGTTNPSSELQVVGTITATTFVGALTGNASTVTTNANLTGDVTSVGNATSIAAGVIVNADVNASAAIAGTKIAPNFGSQTITTTGVISPALGTAAAPSIAFTGDTNTGIYSPGADQVAVATNGTGRLFVDSGGRLLVGTSTSRIVGGVERAVQIEGTSATPGLSLYRNTNDATPAALHLGKSRGTAVGSNTIVQANDSLGLIAFYGSDGSAPRPGAWISASADGTPGANDMPGRLVFLTTPSGSEIPTERLRITSAGRVGIGTSSPTDSLLDVNGNIRVRGIASDPVNSDANFYTLSGVGGTLSSLQWRFVTGANNVSAGTERLRITSTGLVGIGTTNPSSELQVVGTITATTLTLGAAGTATTHAVRADRSISTGDGLSGGGDLTADRTLTVDNTVVRTSGNQTIAGLKTFNSAISAPQNNTTTGGGINFNAAGSAFIRGRNQDGASNTLSNLQLQSWFGIGFGPSISNQTVPVGENAFWINVRDGSWASRGAGTVSSTLSLGTQATTTSHAVRADRSISTGDGLSGGGDLTADRTLTVDNTVVRTSGNQTIGGTKSFSGVISLTASAVADALNLNNNNIIGVNNIKIADPGPQEGIEWVGGNGWKIYESPDNQTNTLGNLQVVSGANNGTRRATFYTNGDFLFGGTLTGGTVPWARLSDVPSSLSNTVNLTGDQTIDGNKTFNGTVETSLNASGTLNGEVLLQRIRSNAGNTAFLDIKSRRHTAGSDWTGVGFRLQHQVDSTQMGFIEFNSIVESRNLVLGTGGSPRLLITNTGNVGIGTTSPATLLHLSSATGSVSPTPTEIRIESTTDASNWTANLPWGRISFYSADISGNGPKIDAAITAAKQGSTGGNSSLGFWTDAGLGAGLENRLVITPGGDVGIGTTSPNELLEVAGNIHLSGADRSIFNRSNNALTFGTNNTERARIDSSGRMLVGTSVYRSVGDTFFPTGMFYSEGTGTAHYQAFVGVSNRNDVGGPILVFGKSRGTVVGSNTIVANGDQLGSIRFAGANGTNLSARGAEIFCEVDGTPSSTSMPGRLVFRTTPSGTTITTERMRITNTGAINLNTTSGANINVGSGTQDGATFYVPGGTGGILQASNNNNIVAFFRRRGSDGSVIDFRRDTTSVGAISVTTTSTAYNTSSDYRLKENVVDLDGAIDRLKLLPVHRFNFIADPDTVVDGFIAHEAAEVVPECVTGTKDEVDEDGNPEYQGIDQSKIVPLLTAALQEAIGEIELLKTRVAALEGVG